MQSLACQMAGHHASPLGGRLHRVHAAASAGHEAAVACRGEGAGHSEATAPQHECQLVQLATGYAPRQSAASSRSAATLHTHPWHQQSLGWSPGAAVGRNWGALRRRSWGRSQTRQVAAMAATGGGRGKAATDRPCFMPRCAPQSGSPAAPAGRRRRSRSWCRRRRGPSQSPPHQCAGPAAGGAGQARWCEREAGGRAGLAFQNCMLQPGTLVNSQCHS